MKITLHKIHGSLVPYSVEDAEALQKLSDDVYTVDIKNLDTRSAAQNRSIHLWAEKIAHELNRNGLYMTGIFQNEIIWNMSLVKEQIIKSLIKTLFNIDSTTKLKRKEVDQLIDYITAIFARKGVTIPPFPSRELFDEIKDKKC